MDTQKSIYDYIFQNIKDGKLEDGFSLPAYEVKGVKFADGAMDGITYYHMGRTELGEAGMELLVKAVKNASSGHFQDADSAFSELGKTHRAISTIDDLQGYIIGHKDELSSGYIYQCARYLVRLSADRESVKFGLSMLELFVVKDDSVKEVIRNIGLSDEFTIFALWNIRKWDDANEVIFDLIQKVRGWGRIHALEQLEPETPEISEWILLNGTDNDVMPSYSALTAWEKADVEKRLQGEIDQQEFRAIGDILCALLDEGPVPGISEIENAKEDILKYLSMADGFTLETEDHKNIQALRDWVSEKADQ